MSNAIAHDDKILLSIEKLALVEQDSSKVIAEKLFAGQGGRMKDSDCVVGSVFIDFELAEGLIVDFKVGKGFTGVKFEVFNVEETMLGLRPCCFGGCYKREDGKRQGDLSEELHLCGWSGCLRVE
jgi:hypothetical protein